MRAVTSFVFACLLGAASASAQLPVELSGCLDGKGNLYNLSPSKGEVVALCNGSDLNVVLGAGSITGIKPGQGLVGGGVSGDVGIGIDPKFALPPSCPVGQVALSDDNGGWICTPKSQVLSPNPVGKLWVLPTVRGAQDRGDRQFFGSYTFGTRVRIVNTSAASGTVTCVSFNSAGSALTHLTTTQAVGTGARAECRTVQHDGPNEALDPKWMLVASNVTVRVGAWVEVSARARKEALALRHEAYSVDCRDPVGTEFVCDWVARNLSDLRE